MQSVSSRIWTRVAMSISYDDNHYTTKQSDGDAGALRNAEHFFIPLLPGPLWPGMIAPDRTLSMG